MTYIHINSALQCPTWDTPEPITVSFKFWLLYVEQWTVVKGSVRADVTNLLRRSQL